LITITIPPPPNIRPIDPATNTVSDETFVALWRMVPSVNNVALTGPDNGSSICPRHPNPAGGYQLDARLGTLQEQALRALVNHAQIQQPGTLDAGVSDQPVQRNIQPVPAAGRYGVARAIRIRPVSGAAGPERADLRDHAVGADTAARRTASGRDQGAEDELGSGPRAPDRVRWRAGSRGRPG
jgi:hypothetical protein